MIETREGFMVLAAVGWVDGTLEPAEAEAIVAAAEDSGVPADEVAALRSRISTRVEPGDLDVANLGTEDRLYLYALAYWVAAVNGTVDLRERALLDVLGHTLRLTARGRTAMDEAVRELLARPAPERPGRFDLRGLRTAIGTRVADAAKARGAQTDGPVRGS